MEETICITKTLAGTYQNRLPQMQYSFRKKAFRKNTQEKFLL